MCWPVGVEREGDDDAGVAGLNKDLGTHSCERVVDEGVHAKAGDPVMRDVQRGLWRIDVESHLDGGGAVGMAGVSQNVQDQPIDQCLDVRG